METTLYQLADAEIRRCIKSYLDLTKSTKNLALVTPSKLRDDRAREILLAGLGVPLSLQTPRQAFDEWQRRQGVTFDLEAGISIGVYRHVRESGATFLDSVERETQGFTVITPDYIHDNPHLLPVFQHLGGVFSKSELKKKIGSASDVAISKPAARKLSDLLKLRVSPNSVNKGEILRRLESTLEGIVRDLVGRVLFESIVDSALQDKKLVYQRESEYTAISGVVYDTRADFVLPSAENPMAFIEVRKSSSRHASLYAKDKMFSAINWKGKHPDLMGVLIVEGEWTKETLRVLANVFDYVVPIGRVPDLVDTLHAYLSGDKTKLKWLIQFRVVSAGTGSTPPSVASDEVSEGADQIDFV